VVLVVVTAYGPDVWGWEAGGSGHWCGNCTACVPSADGTLKRFDVTMLRHYQELHGDYLAGYNIVRARQFGGHRRYRRARDLRDAR